MLSNQGAKIKKKSATSALFCIFAAVLKGVPVKAEIRPVEPDADNAAVGKFTTSSYPSFSVFNLLITKLLEYVFN